MTERKCEWLDGQEWVALTGGIERLVQGRKYTEHAWVSLENFIRARVEEERKDEREACAKVCEKFAEERFDEHGIREWDTGATYYKGRAAEEHEARDEEDEACAKAIRARGGEK